MEMVGVEAVGATEKEVRNFCMSLKYLGSYVDNTH